MPASIPEVADLLQRYARARVGKFSRKDFTAWAAHHGLSRQTAPQTIDTAFSEAITQRVIEQVQTLPEAIYSLYQHARTPSCGQPS
jgi:hypothetical protein